MQATAISPEFINLKTRLKKTWMAGDYDRFSHYMENGARDFYERLNAAPGAQFLDVGCGSGQLALIAARDGLKVTGVDIARNLVERAQERALAENLSARFEEADAEALPFEDSSFDIVASLVGAMFAPRPESVAEELLRVCSPGGTIGMVNWTPRDSSAKCSRRFRNLSRRRECAHRCCGAMRRRYVRGSAQVCLSCPWSNGTTHSAIRFLPRKWWNFFASTTAQPIWRLLRSMRLAPRLFARNSKRCGLRRIARGTVRQQCSPNIWKSSAFELKER
jgi:SAM-dependent methyltransferase